MIHILLFTGCLLIENVHVVLYFLVAAEYGGEVAGHARCAALLVKAYRALLTVVGAAFVVDGCHLEHYHGVAALHGTDEVACLGCGHTALELALVHADAGHEGLAEVNRGGVDRCAHELGISGYVRGLALIVGDEFGGLLVVEGAAGQLVVELRVAGRGEVLIDVVDCHGEEVAGLDVAEYGRYITLVGLHGPCHCRMAVGEVADRGVDADT